MSVPWSFHPDPAILLDKTIVDETSFAYVGSNQEHRSRPQRRFLSQSIRVGHGDIINLLDAGAQQVPVHLLLDDTRLPLALFDQPATQRECLGNRRGMLPLGGIQIPIA